MQFSKYFSVLESARQAREGRGRSDLLLQKTPLIITLFCNFLHMEQIIQLERDNSLKHWKIIKFIMRKMN